MTWSDQQRVRDYVQALPAGTWVITDGDPFGAQSAAVRQARCSGLVPIVVHTPANASKRITQARVIRDDAMLQLLGPGDRVVVFGELDLNRDHVLRTYASRQPTVVLERIGE
jgi:hypothetical protein